MVILPKTYTFFECKKLMFQTKYFDEVHICLIVIINFIKFKLLSTFQKIFSIHRHYKDVICPSVSLKTLGKGM